MLVVLADHMLGICDLHVCRPEELAMHVFLKKSFAGALGLRPKYHADFRAAPFLKDFRLSFDEIVIVLFVAATQNICEVSEQQTATGGAAWPLGRARLDSKAAPRVQRVADHIRVVLWHERH